MRDGFGRRFQCPRCGSYLIRMLHTAFAKGKLQCQNCEFQDRPQYFRAIPEDALIKEFNPSSR